MNEWIPISANSICIKCCHCQHESCFSPISLPSLGRETTVDTGLTGTRCLRPPGALEQLSAPLLRNCSFLCVTEELEGHCLAAAPQKAGRQAFQTEPRPGCPRPSRRSPYPRVDHSLETLPDRSLGDAGPKPRTRSCL